jgi:murein DD-endopeptidase MepM/ murein hydrolase activator NlpD
MGNPENSKWDKGNFSKKKPISDETKKAIFWYYQVALKNGKASDDALNELSQRYDRSIRQIQRYIEQVDKESARKSTGDDLNQTALSKAYDTHFAEVRSFIEHWKGVVEKRSSPFHVAWPPHYGAEQDKFFPYVLDHCPSIKDKYQALQSKRNKYQIQSSELKKSQSGQWEQTFIEAEGELRDALEMSLLSQEYIRHKCDLCP